MVLDTQEYASVQKVAQKKNPLSYVSYQIHSGALRDYNLLMYKREIKKNRLGDSYDGLNCTPRHRISVYMFKTKFQLLAVQIFQLVSSI